MGKSVEVQGTEISIMTHDDKDFISMTDMLKAKDGDFFISDWLRNRNTVEFLGIWEQIHNSNFNYGEFAIIRSNAGLNSYKDAITFCEQILKDDPENVYTLRLKEDCERHLEKVTKLSEEITRKV